MIAGKKVRRFALIASLVVSFSVHAQEQTQELFYSSTTGKIIDENEKLKVTFHISNIRDSIGAVRKVQEFKRYEGVKSAEFKGFEGGKAKYVLILTSFADDKFIQRMLARLKYDSVIIDNESVPVTDFVRHVEERRRVQSRESKLEK